MRSGLHNIDQGFISQKTGTLQQIESGFVRAAHEAAGAADAECTFVAATGNTTNQSSYTFSGHAIGTASSDRHVIVITILQQSGGGAPITPTVTVAGQSCTSVATAVPATAERVNIFITDSPVTTGTTADIVVNEGSTQHGCYIGVYAATGLNSTTPTDTIEDNSDPLSGTIDCDAGGFIVGVGQTASNGASFTWAGITEDFDGDFDVFEPTGAHGNFASAQTGLTVSLTPTAFTRALMAVASFR